MRYKKGRKGIRVAFVALTLAVAMTASIPALQAQTETAVATPLSPRLPKGSIVAFLPDMQSKGYSDLKGLKRWLQEQGWAICDGSEGTPDLNFRMLLGTVHPEEAGHNLGSRTHRHRISGNTDNPNGREHQVRSGIGRALRVPADGHKHRLDAGTEQAEHLPLSLRVVYIMKIR